MATRGFEHITSEAELLAIYGRGRKRDAPVNPSMAPTAHVAQLSEDEAEAIGIGYRPKTKRAKFRNRRTLRDGLIFDSGIEADYWFDILKIRERAGEIVSLDRQWTYPLYCPIFLDSDPTQPIASHVVVAEYRADYVWYERDGRFIVADKKPKDEKVNRTAEYKIKKRWMLLQYGIEIQEV